MCTVADEGGAKMIDPEKMMDYILPVTLAVLTLAIFVSLVMAILCAIGVL